MKHAGEDCSPPQGVKLPSILPEIVSLSMYAISPLLTETEKMHFTLFLAPKKTSALAQ